jgi:hypothetical protein
MKNIHIILIFLLFLNVSFSQEELTIDFEVNHFVFEGITAPIRIVGCIDVDNLEVTAVNAKLEKDGNNKYSLLAKRKDSVAIKIYNKKTKTTQSIPIRVLDFPAPRAVLSVGSFFDNARIALRRSRGLKTEDTEFMWMDIHGAMLYDLTVIHKNQVFRFEDQKGWFSNNIKSLFNLLEKGDLVTFYNVRLKPYDTDLVLELNNLIFEIED